MSSSDTSGELDTCSCFISMSDCLAKMPTQPSITLESPSVNESEYKKRLRNHTLIQKPLRFTFSQQQSAQVEPPPRPRKYTLKNKTHHNSNSTEDDSSQRSECTYRFRNRALINKPPREPGNISLNSNQEISTQDSSFNHDKSPSGTHRKNHKATSKQLIYKKPKLEDGNDEDDDDTDIENMAPPNEDDYESLVQKNIREKLAFLQSLNIPQAIKNYQEGLPKKPTRAPRGLGTKSPVVAEPRRASNRLLRLGPDGESLTEEAKLKSKPSSIYPYKMARQPVAEPLGLKSTTQKIDFDTIEKFLNVLSGDLLPTKQKNVIYTKETLSGMVNTETLIAKVNPDRIYSLAVHPGITSHRLVAAGGRNGFLGLWDVGSNEGADGVFLFRPCQDSINCMSFEQEALICASYEGTLKKLDLRTGEFDHLYATPENVKLRCTHFDSLTNQCYIISLNNGDVVTVDPRTKGLCSELEMECHKTPIKTISVHPLKKDYFLTASNDRTVCMWDLRNHKSFEAVAKISQNRSINSAYFSPEKGNLFHTVGYNDTVSVYDSTDLGSVFQHVVEIRHNNQVGRWITPFRGQWLPNNDELFAVGNKENPRSINIFDASSGKRAHTFTSKYLQSIVSVIAFHPKIPFMACGNSNGRVYVFEKNDD